jgi:hypothetical protein
MPCLDMSFVGETIPQAALTKLTYFRNKVHIRDMAEHMDMHLAEQIQGDHSSKVINYQ